MRRARPQVVARGLLAAVLAAGAAAFGPLSPLAAEPPQAGDSPDASDAGENDEASSYRNGLLAVYAGADGVEHRRLEEQLAFEWPAGSPDRRVAPGAFRARFSGQLQAQVPGEYRLSVYAAGRVRVELGGREVISAAAREPAWLDGTPLELEYGFHPLVVSYERTDEPARIALFWQGPQFQLEPLSARWLFHDKSASPSDEFERGARLVRALRCAGCHEIAGERAPLAAPALDCLTGNLSRAWLVEWLAASAGGEQERRGLSSRRMPHFGFDRQAAADVADYLFSVSESRYVPPPKVPPPAPTKTKKTAKDAEAEKPPTASIGLGAELVHSRGCLACHRVDSLGGDGLFGGGDLTRVADKRPGDFFARWLTTPAAINRDARMPGFALGGLEWESVSLYLQSLKSPSPPADFSGQTNLERGRGLVGQAGCANCHRLSPAAGIERAARLKPLDVAALDRGETCLDAPDASRHRPGYRLSAEERQAVVALVAGASRARLSEPWHDARDLLAERNCLGCHARGLAPGLAPQLPAVAAKDGNLRAILAALVPPALQGVGDKLADRALEAAITRSAAPRQPWLRVEMPRFRLAVEETAALARHFIAADRIPDRPPDGRSPRAGETQSAATLEAAGARLVTAAGFGCTSCHAIGRWQPEKVAINAQGVNLRNVGATVRREWFQRWVRNPARLVPQMEMPAVVQPVRGVLDGRLDEQLAAVWFVINHGDFTPPPPAALRVVRRSNLPGSAERAAVLTDVIEVGGRTFVKPLVIGLANRHNVLFDLATGRLAAWWLGDTAAQQTPGKSWRWQAGGTQLLRVAEADSPEETSELLLVDGDKRLSPERDGQYLTAFDRFEHTRDGGITFAYRLRFEVGGSRRVVRLVDEFAPLANEGRFSGFRRRIEIEGIPPGTKAEFAALAGKVELNDDGRTARRGQPRRHARSAAASARRFAIRRLSARRLRGAGRCAGAGRLRARLSRRGNRRPVSDSAANRSPRDQGDARRRAGF